MCDNNYEKLWIVNNLRNILKVKNNKNILKIVITFQINLLYKILKYRYLEKL